MLKGAGYRNPLAGTAFTVGALSMVGLPMFSGFIAKVLFAQAGYQQSDKTMVTLLALAISTLLNVIYFMRAVLTIYTPLTSVSDEQTRNYQKIHIMKYPEKVVIFAGFMLINLILGLMSQPITELCSRGLEMFG